MNEPYEVIADTREISRADWLALRRTGIGGSDAGAIMGMSKWASPLSVWADKRGLLPETPDNDAMAYGRKMEPVLREWFAEQFEKQEHLPCTVTPFTCMLRSAAFSWAIADLDGMVNLAPGRIPADTGGLELKTADAFSQARYWKDGELPDGYYCQVQHYMAVTGWPFFYVFCLLGKKPIIRYVPRNDAFINTLMKAEKVLWQMVLDNDMPAPSGMDCDDDVLSVLYQGGGAESISIQELDGTMESLVNLRQEIKEKQFSAIELAQRVKLAMGNAKRGQGAGYHATWSRFPVNRIDTAALKKDLPEVAAKYSKESQGERFTAAANGKKGEE